MKIEAHILCYNEEKMVRHTLNHYFTFCDEIIIHDNESNDKTLDIIEKEYPHVKVEQFKSNNQCREDVQTSLRNNCWKDSKADWVIVCDMDEFIYQKNMREFLEIIKNYPLPKIEGYNMFSDTFTSNYNELITKQIKYGVRAFNFDKQIVFNPKKVKEINFTLGSHGCSPELYKNDTITRPSNPLYLLHYKYLGEQYLVNKHKEYASRLSTFNMSNLCGCEYLKGVEHIKQCINLIKTSNKLVKVI